MIFDRFLLMLKEIPGNEQPSTIKLAYTPFWVRAYDLPLNVKKKETACMLGNKVGKFIMKDLDDTRWGRFLRFRALINLRLPLKRGIMIQ